MKTRVEKKGNEDEDKRAMEDGLELLETGENEVGQMGDRLELSRGGTRTGQMKGGELGVEVRCNKVGVESLGRTEGNQQNCSLETKGKTEGRVELSGEQGETEGE